MMEEGWFLSLLRICTWMTKTKVSGWVRVRVVGKDEKDGVTLYRVSEGRELTTGDDHNS